ncbi:Two-component system sensor histidine kinase [Olavius algarvensis associated proteobacterium Delta 3]|nr:Two-component system sensor histidine kinase [Olavius algarvensis associated proteobacterium Delta 3]CAB5122857.1 Two-component system sensor histidine kinase [Olavius algarvensis associated proteobacterium Delta 3]
MKASPTNDPRWLIRRVKENEEIAKKFFLVERQILSVLNFQDLFKVLLSAIQKTFQVPYVWLSMIDTSDVYRLVQSLTDMDVFHQRLTLVKKSAFESLIGSSMTPILINSDLDRFRDVIPVDAFDAIQSMALAPLSLDGEIIGSLNQGDKTKARFEPGIDTGLLEQLGIKLSLCLSNVTAHEKLRYLAYRDVLTGLLNRRVVKNILEREFARSRRYQSPLSIAFLDLNDFKGINDTYGHEVGDLVLMRIGDILTQLSRESDAVARYAGDEFVVILPETSKLNAEALMKRVSFYVSEHPATHGSQTIPISFSYGCAATTDQGVKDPTDLLRKADKRLYRAKHLRKPENKKP